MKLHSEVILSSPAPGGAWWWYSTPAPGVVQPLLLVLGPCSCSCCDVTVPIPLYNKISNVALSSAWGVLNVFKSTRPRAHPPTHGSECCPACSRGGPAAGAQGPALRVGQSPTAAADAGGHTGRVGRPIYLNYRDAPDNAPFWDGRRAVRIQT